MTTSFTLGCPTRRRRPVALPLAALPEFVHPFQSGGHRSTRRIAFDERFYLAMRLRLPLPPELIDALTRDVDGGRGEWRVLGWWARRQRRSSARGSHLRTKAVRQFGMRSSRGATALLVELLAIAGCAPAIAQRSPEAGSPLPTAAPRPLIPPLEGAAAVVGVASVIDGDTIEIHGQRIRLHGIDAPEASQLCELGGKPWRCGQASANALADYIGRRTVSCDPRDRDRYGRLVAACSVGGASISAWMVREGWAIAYRRYSQDFVADEAAARASRRGIWRSVFIVPWEWRAQHRSGGAGIAGSARLPSTASENHRSGCDIKGNINSRGDRIYHVPGSRSYASTVVDSAHGERWFCSEAEARAAGWRPPK